MDKTAIKNFCCEKFDKLKKYFGEYDMTWPRVIILAIATAVITAVLKLIPFLKDTSFQDIAITFECWILFAVFIIVNCKKWQEAALKCFVFFLISQPLIYLIQVPFYDRGWAIFDYYKYWFIMTILTIPGAIIAYQVKKKNWLSVAVLSVANGYLAYMCVSYFKSAMSSFPNHLLSSIFCLALAVFFIFVLLERKNHRIAALAVVLLVMIASVFILSRDASTEITLDEGTWSYSMSDDSIVNIEMTDANHAKLTARHDGYTYLYFEDTEGNTRTYHITVSGGGIWVTPLDDDTSGSDVSGGDIVVSDTSLAA